MDLKALKVTSVDGEGITFEGGITLSSYHNPNCCETHSLDFEPLSLADFEGMRFNLDGEGFFKRIEGYGIELLPIQGHPVRIAGYGINNGYYSSDLELVVSGPNYRAVYDVTECQKIAD